MTCPDHKPSDLVGCSYAAFMAAAGILAAWQMTFGDFDIGAWMLASAWFAGRSAFAVRTIAYQRAQLVEMRRTAPGSHS